MGRGYTTRNGRTSKRGAFVAGIWQCDCDPRLPADKFQTKNGGKNHGRWFYTCQKPQHKRCGFFLWSDEAKVREEAAVLSNSTSEPMPPTTPRKAGQGLQPPTPETRTRVIERPQEKKIDHSTDANVDKGNDDSFDWSSSNDEELLKVEREATNQLLETPRKTPRTNTVSSPGKLPFTQIVGQRKSGDGTAPLDDDVFATPSTVRKPPNAGVLSPTSISTRASAVHSRPDSEPSPLAAEVLAILQPARLDPGVEKELIDLLNRHDLRTQGISKGRDITRLAVQAKEKRIAELQARITQLEAERETNKTVIAHLKHDMAASPKKQRGRESFQGRKSKA